MTKQIQEQTEEQEKVNAPPRPRLEPGGDDEAWQKADENSLPTSLPDDAAVDAALADDAAEGEAPSTSAVPLTAENIGLGRVAGINEAEVGRELNVEGDQDNDEDDSGNPVDAFKAGVP